MKWDPRRAQVWLAALLLSLGLSAAAVAAAASTTTVLYPNAQATEFSVEIPAGWSVEAADESGGFVSFTSPAGARLSLRTVPAEPAALAESMARTSEWMNQNYSGLRLDQPLTVPAGAFEGLRSQGNGMRRSDGRNVLLALDWFLFQRDRHIEAWLELLEEDEDGYTAAASIIASLRPR